MTPACAPEPTMAVAMRLSTYLDCQARALGESGFEAFAGGPLGTALLSGCATIFVALIGYRVLLGHMPDVRDGVGWALRLGIVFALVTSWPAFQALVYRVAVDGPGEIAAIVMPPSGLPAENLNFQIQQAYDVLRIGIGEDGAPTGTQSGQAAQGDQAGVLPPVPMTASLLVISTAGLTGALRMGVGFLLAIAPIAFVSLLFSGSIGLFNGWVRALAGLALGLIGIRLVTAIDLMMIDSELARLQQLTLTNPTATDHQAMTTIVASFTVVAAVTVFAGGRMGSALGLSAVRRSAPQSQSRDFASSRLDPVPVTVGSPHPRSTAFAERARAAVVAEALSTAVHREQRLITTHQSPDGIRPLTATNTSEPRDALAPQGIGIAGRRGTGRHTRSAVRRDQIT